MPIPAIAATMMACPDPQTRVETAFFRALEATRSKRPDLLDRDGSITRRTGVKRREE